MLTSLLTGAALPYVVAALGAAVLYLLHLLRKEKAAGDIARLEKGVEVVSAIVTELDKTLPTPVLDKVALAVTGLDAYLKAHDKDAAPTEIEKARDLFKALTADKKETK